MYVKHNLWKGRVHSTMAVDEAKDGEEVSLVTSSLTTRELKARRRHVFHDVRVGDEVMARVVGIRQTKIAKYVLLGVMEMCPSQLLACLFVFSVLLFCLDLCCV